jgi:hypothetical protein
MEVPMPHNTPNESPELAPGHGYEPPVSKLLTLGERPLIRFVPLDYLALGIGEQHLAELARMSRDPLVNDEESDESLGWWAPIHAMRAIIQIGSEATIEPLVRLLEYEELDDSEDICDWFLEEIPEGLADIGAPAIHRTAELLRDDSMHIYSRAAAASALTKIARRHPESRPECLRLLTYQLGLFAENDPEWNGWLVADLLEIKANEAAPLIEQAFAADRVDETIVGDWDEVQAKLGLRPPLSDEEYAEKCRKRQAAHGWLEVEDYMDDEFDEELAEELAADWDDSGDQAWDRLTGEPERVQRFAMPEDIYTADERRNIAKQRNKERKAADRAKARRQQNKKRS